MTTITVYKPADVSIEIIDRPVVAADLPQWAVDLPVGRAVAISQNTLADIASSVQPNGGTIIKGSDAWCSGVDIPELGRYGAKIFSGGGDADSWDNGVYAFDYESCRWAVVRPGTQALSWRPADDPQFDMAYGTHGDGTPAVPHTYDAMVAIPNGFCWPGRRFYYPQRKSNWIFSFDTVTREWVRYPSALPISINAEICADYDPKSHCVYALPATMSGTWAATVAWVDVQFGDVGTYPLSGRVLVKGPATLRAVDHALYWLQDGAIMRIDLATDAVTTTPIGLPPWLNGNVDGRQWYGCGMAWVPQLRCFFAKPAGPASEATSLYRITPDPWRWEHITLDVATGYGNGLWKKFEWNNRLRALTWWHNAAGNVYAYRPVGV